jgi:hypothetical protein
VGSGAAEEVEDGSSLHTRAHREREGRCLPQGPSREWPWSEDRWPWPGVEQPAFLSLGSTNCEAAEGSLGRNVPDPDRAVRFASRSRARPILAKTQLIRPAETPDAALARASLALDSSDHAAPARAGASPAVHGAAGAVIAVTAAVFDRGVQRLEGRCFAAASGDTGCDGADGQDHGSPESDAESHAERVVTNGELHRDPFERNPSVGPGRGTGYAACSCRAAGMTLPCYGRDPAGDACCCSRSLMRFGAAVCATAITVIRGADDGPLKTLRYRASRQPR